MKTSKLLFILVIFSAFTSYCMDDSTQTAEYSINEQLFQAVKSNDLAKVKQSLLQGAKINVFDKDGFSPLMYAASMSRAVIVNLLLKSGADATSKNDYGYNALFYASFRGQSVYHNVDSSTTKIYAAEETMIIKNLGAAGAQSGNGQFLSHFKQVESLVQSGQEESIAFFKLIKSGDIQSIIKQLQSLPFLIFRDNDGNTPLHIAVQECIKARDLKDEAQQKRYKRLSSLLLSKNPALASMKNKKGIQAIQLALPAPELFDIFETIIAEKK